MRIVPSRLLVLAALLSLSVLSGCGKSTDNDTRIPSSEEIFYQYSAFLNHSTGTVMTSGYNRYGQLANGTLTNRFFFLPTIGQNNFLGISKGANHVLAYQANAVWAWGSNLQGRLGTGVLFPTSGGLAFASFPQQVSLAGPIHGVSAGAHHSLAIAGAEHTVYAWGGNSTAQLGSNSVVDSPFPAAVKANTAGAPLTGISKVAAGAFHSLALNATDGKLYGWGSNSIGQLGLGTILPYYSVATEVTSVPLKVNEYIVDKLLLAGDRTSTVFPAGVAIADIAAAGSYSLALISAASPYTALDGTVWGWGYNGYGQLGLRTGASSQADPAPILKLDGTPLTGVKKVSAGLMHVVALVGTSDGRNEVWAWGFGEKGQLGNGATLLFSSAPLKASILDAIPGTIEDVEAFGNQSFARIAGKWYGWGDNSWGQLGQPVVTGSLPYLLNAKALGF